MIGGKVTVDGLPELHRRLTEFAPKIARHILRSSLKVGAQPILHAARSAAPFRTGLLVSSLRVRTGMSRRKGEMYASIGTKAGDYRGKTFYGAFVEYGHKLGKRRRKRGLIQGFISSVANRGRKDVPGVQYLQKAYERSKHQALRAFVEDLKRGIEREASKQ